MSVCLTESVRCIGLILDSACLFLSKVSVKIIISQHFCLSQSFLVVFCLLVYKNVHALLFWEGKILSNILQEKILSNILPENLSKYLNYGFCYKSVAVCLPHSIIFILFPPRVLHSARLYIFNAFLYLVCVPETSFVILCLHIFICLHMYKYFQTVPVFAIFAFSLSFVCIIWLYIFILQTVC